MPQHMSASHVAEPCCEDRREGLGERGDQDQAIRTLGRAGVTVSTPLLSFRVAWSPCPGPCASASAQGCSVLLSTCMAWTSSTATSRGQSRVGLAKGLGCEAGPSTCSWVPFLSLRLLLFAFLSPLFLPWISSFSLLHPQKSLLLGCALWLLSEFMPA